MTYTDAPLIDDTGRDLGRCIYSSLPARRRDIRKLRQGGDLLPVLLHYSVLFGATMAFRADLRPLALPIPALWGHDEWIGLVANALGPAQFVNRPAMRYRQHARQQLGVGDWTLATHLQVARNKGQRFYEQEVERLDNGLASLRTRPELTGLIAPLEHRRAFYAARLAAFTRGPRALPGLTHALLRGHYRRYASGLRSWLKDLLVILRSRRRRAPQHA